MHNPTKDDMETPIFSLISLDNNWIHQRQIKDRSKTRDPDKGDKGVLQKKGCIEY
jgi:adenylate kinase